MIPGLCEPGAKHTPRGRRHETPEQRRRWSSSKYPLLVLIVSFLVLWLAAQTGAGFLRRLHDWEGKPGESYATILAATLTLLGLIIGFTFSMAVNRYDQRKNLEEEEANAIGTEYARAGLLPAGEAAKVRTLMRGYLDQRVLFYVTRDAGELQRINARTAQLQSEMWEVVQAVAAAQPTPTIALAVGGMNDVLNSQGYTQAAWWNRIPTGAWLLMAAIAVLCNLLVGFGSTRDKHQQLLLLILPLSLSVSFFLIADIDSPRHGVIRVSAQNLQSLVESLRVP